MKRPVNAETLQFESKKRHMENMPSSIRFVLSVFFYLTKVIFLVSVKSPDFSM